MEVEPLGLEIFLGFDHICFSPGKPVTGIVFIRATKPTTIERIGLNWFGCEQVEWVQGLFQGDKIAVQNMLFQHKQIIFPSEAEETTKKEISEGLHKFPFSWELPENLPSSYLYTSEELKMYVKERFVSEPSFPYPTVAESKRPSIKYTLVAFVDEATVNESTPMERKLISQDFLVQETFSIDSLSEEPVFKRLTHGGFFYGSPLKINFSLANGPAIFSTVEKYLV